MSKIHYLIVAILFCFWGVYFIAIKEWCGAIMNILAAFLNITWFIRELKAGGINE